MPPPCPPASPTSLDRLLAGLESGAAEEERLAGRQDWAALSALVERETSLVQRLVHEKQTSGRIPAPDILARIATLQTHYAAMQSRLREARGRVSGRLGELGAAGRRVREVRRAYQTRAA
jgi:hypothetical protein